MIRFLKLLPLLLLAALFAAFAVDNRTGATLSLFPLPYSIELPVFLLVMIFFIFGVVVAGIIATVKFYQSRIQFIAARHKIEALENEVAGLRAERNILPPAA